MTVNHRRNGSRVRALVNVAGLNRASLQRGECSALADLGRRPPRIAA